MANNLTGIEMNGESNLGNFSPETLHFNNT